MLEVRGRQLLHTSKRIGVSLNATAAVGEMVCANRVTINMPPYNGLHIGCSSADSKIVYLQLQVYRL